MTPVLAPERRPSEQVSPSRGWQVPGRVGGRLGLVLPAELLTVNYAAEVRRFLIERFTKVDVIMFTERVFPEVQEEVVLLLAGGFDEGAAGRISFYQARNADDLAKITAARTWSPSTPGEQWAAALLPGPALDVYSAVLRPDRANVSICHAPPWRHFTW